MKKNKIIFCLFFLMFIFGCSKVEDYNEQGFTYPSKKNNPRLLFPKEAQMNGYSGTAKVYMFISNEGKVEQVGIEESSGYDVLDLAAVNYCYKLEFKPATMDGNPVNSRIVQNFKFNFIDNDYTVMQYILEIDKLYKQEKFSSAARKKVIQNRILSRHKAFLKDMDDVMNYNIVLEKVIQPEVQSEWKEYWNAFPLSFLLYHDFLQRFPESDSTEVVKSYIKSAVEADLQYINTSSAADIDSKEKGKMLVNKIKVFVEEHYPEIRIDDYSMDEINS